MTLADEIRASKHVYICGNGGSAANAIHMANDLVNAGVRAHALTADVATLTAIANDYGYEHVFSRQLRVFAEPGDLLICLSGSGSSPNIIEALKTASAMGVRAVAVIGSFNREAKALDVAQKCIVNGRDMQVAEEYQQRLGHELMLELRCA